jgi:PAS domain S-box-containing protein
MKSAAVNILVVENEESFVGLLETILLEEGRGDYRVAAVGTLAAALEQLETRAFDLVLTDLSLPDARGLETFRALHQMAPAVPVIVLSGQEDEALALEMLRAGAQDYLLKCEFDGRLLGRAIRYALERRAVVAQLRDSEEFFRLIAENVTDLISVVDEKGRRLYSSPSHHEVLGARDSLIGSNSFAEIHPADREAIQSTFREVVASGRGRRTEYRFVRGDGAVRHVESQSSVIKDETGAPRKVVMVSRDVTERLKTEQDLVAALAEVKRTREQQLLTQRRQTRVEKLELIRQFANLLSQELTGPLQNIRAGIELCPAPVGQDGVAAGPQILEAAKYAEAVVRSLSEFTSLHPDGARDLNLGPVVDSVVAERAPEIAARGILLQVQHAVELPPLLVDAKSLRQVLNDLVRTEINRCVSGGEITLRTYLRAPAAGGQRRSQVVAEITTRPNAPSGLAGLAGFGAAPGVDDCAQVMARQISGLFGGVIEPTSSRGGMFRSGVSFEI